MRRFFRNVRHSKVLLRSLPVWTVAIAMLSLALTAIGIATESAGSEPDPPRPRAGGPSHYLLDLSGLLYKTGQVLLLNLDPAGASAPRAAGQALAVVFATLFSYQVIKKLFDESWTSASLHLTRAQGDHAIVCGLGAAGYNWCAILR